MFRNSYVPQSLIGITTWKLFIIKSLIDLFIYFCELVNIVFKIVCGNKLHQSRTGNLKKITLLDSIKGPEEYNAK